LTINDAGDENDENFTELLLLPWGRLGLLSDLQIRKETATEVNIAWRTKRVAPRYVSAYFAEHCPAYSKG